MLERVLSSAAIAVGLALAIHAPARAAPAAATAIDAAGKDGRIIEVFGGCGVYGHRGPFGGCRPGGQFGGYIWGRSCPPGFHIGPYGRHCWRNRFW